ncbi:MAG: cupin domain-containing protein [Alphaproteobacteria bacterium]|nr:cupin domain-containing protein [Alphaproteobacteria bacterium]
MTAATRTNSPDLQSRLRAHIGRHTDKQFDWDAFPANRGYADLARAQMRYVGAGGSPKNNDRSTLPPGNYTVSLVHQPPGKYAALHAHEIEEAFLVLDGVLTVGWQLDGDVIAAKLGPRDMIMNTAGVPHGFRNDGVEAVLMSIMVGRGKPHLPVYHAHPKDTDPAVAAALGSRREHMTVLEPNSAAAAHRQMASCILRHSEQRPQWDPAGFARTVYVGAGAVAANHNRKELITAPPGKGVRAYRRPVEDSYFVLSGCLVVGWQEDGRTVEAQLGPRDLVWNPPGQARYFRNDGATTAEFFKVIGTAAAEDVLFEAA